MSRGLVYEIAAAGAASVVAEPGGNPTGLAEDQAGRVWIAQGGGHSRTSSKRAVGPGIQCLRGGEVIDVLGTGLDAPNDCAVDRDGAVWFTDPRGSALGRSGPPGRVLRLDPDAGEVSVLAEGIHYPNGLAFAPGGGVLYVAETRSSRILRFEVAGDWLVGREVFATLAGAHPDGLAIDREGRLFVAAPPAAAVFVLGADGSTLEVLRLAPGSLPTNLCFGGPAMSTLFVTAAKGGRVLRLELGVRGLELPSRHTSSRVVNVSVDKPPRILYGVNRPF